MLWSNDTCQNKVSADQYHVTISREKFREKFGTSHWDISFSCTQECDNVTAIMLLHLRFQVVAYGRLKKVQNFSSKSGRGRLLEEVTLKRFQI